MHFEYIADASEYGAIARASRVALLVTCNFDTQGRFNPLNAKGCLFG